MELGKSSVDDVRQYRRPYNRKDGRVASNGVLSLLQDEVEQEAALLLGLPSGKPKPKAPNGRSILSSEVRERNRGATNRWWQPSRSRRRTSRTRRAELVEALREEEDSPEALPFYAEVDEPVCLIVHGMVFDPAREEVCESLRVRVRELELGLLTTDRKRTRRNVERRLATALARLEAFEEGLKTVT